MILVNHIFETARKRLAVLGVEASLFDAARILTNRDTPLIVVCDSDGTAVGVISSGQVLNVLATEGPAIEIAMSLSNGVREICSDTSSTRSC